MENNIYVCVYNGVTVLYSKNWHNIVNQIYFNKIDFLETIGWGSIEVILVRKEISIYCAGSMC